MRDLSPDIADPLLRLLDIARRGTARVVCVRVDSYDARRCVADVTPLASNWRSGRDGSRVWVEPQRIPACPVLWPGGADRGVTMGLSKGDLALALSRSVSHQEVDGAGTTPSRPVVDARHRIVDAVVFPGYTVPADGRPPEQYRDDGQPVAYLPSGEALHIGASTAAELLGRADLILQQLEAIQSGLDNHDHPLPQIVAPTGGGPCTVNALVPTGSTLGGGSYTAPSTPSDIASDRVKVDS